jgi:hypothetical protein
MTRLSAALNTSIEAYGRLIDEIDRDTRSWSARLAAITSNVGSPAEADAAAVEWDTVAPDVPDVPGVPESTTVVERADRATAPPPYLKWQLGKKTPKHKVRRAPLRVVRGPVSDDVVYSGDSDVPRRE